MTQVFQYIPVHDVNYVDSYEGPVRLHTFSNMRFRTQLASQHSFQIPLGIHNSKIINITNKQLSFLIQQTNHHIYDNYSAELLGVYNNLRANPNEDIQIDEPVFYFFDYESVSGTVHSYDCMFYLLYMYCNWKFNCRLLVVKSNNVYYNTTLALIKKYFNVDFLYIEPNKNYNFKEFHCIRNYVNVLFHEVKNFVNERLIDPVMKKFEGKEYYKNVCKIKYGNPNDAHSGYNFSRTEKFNTLCKTYDVYDISNIEDEEYKIYLLNKAENIIVSWGSIYYINIVYYLRNHQDHFISVLFHKNLMAERSFLQNGYQNIGHHCGKCTNQVYTSLHINCEIIDNMTSLDQFVDQTLKFR